MVIVNLLAKIKFKYIIVALMILIKVKSFAQSPANSHFFLNLINENPANTSLLEEKVIALNYRNQFPGLSANYINYGFFYSQPIRVNNSSIGVSLINDDQGSGIINNLEVSAIYGYKVKIANRSHLHFGLQTSFVQKSYSLGNLTLEDQRESLAKENTLYFDFGLGVKATINNLYFGGAVQHATPPLLLQGINLNYTNPRMYLLEAGIDIPISYNSVYQPEFAVSPSLMIKYAGGHQLIQVGSSLTKRPIQVGFWLRQDFIFNYDAFVFSFAFFQSKFNFVYSYDVKPPWLMEYFQNSGAHEVTFFINLEYNEKRKLRAIKCPKI